MPVLSNVKMSSNVAISYLAYPSYRTMNVKVGGYARAQFALEQWMLKLVAMPELNLH